MFHRWGNWNTDRFNGMFKFTKLEWRHPDSHPSPLVPKPVLWPQWCNEKQILNGESLLLGFNGQKSKTTFWADLHRYNLTCTDVYLIVIVILSVMSLVMGEQGCILQFSWCLYICYFFPNTSFQRGGSTLHDFILPLESNLGLII